MVSKLSELLSVYEEFCFVDILSCVVESNSSCLYVDIESDGRIAAGKTAAILETVLLPCNPQANSTAIDAFPIGSGYMTKKGEATNLPLNDEVDFLGKFRNGQGLGNEDKTVVGNPNQESASGGTANIGGKRERNLTERG